MVVATRSRARRNEAELIARRTDLPHPEHLADGVGKTVPLRDQGLTRL